MANNFNLGARSMKKAGDFALKNAVSTGHLSFSSAATIGHRWNQFLKWLKEGQGVKKLEAINFDLIKEYGKELAFMVTEGDMSPSSGQNYLSAINTVMDLASKGQWKSVSPTHDCGIPQRALVRTEVPASLNRETYRQGLDAIRIKLGDRGATIVELCRELGLRSKEASLIDAQTLSETSKISGFVSIIDGTKGGRARVIPLVSTIQKEAIELAAKVQGEEKSLIPSNQCWREWRDGDLRNIREAVQKILGAPGLHDLRAAFACERYETLTGFKSPLMGTPRPNKETDNAARQKIAEELGHSRSEVTNAYLGGKK